MVGTIIVPCFGARIGNDGQAESEIFLNTWRVGRIYRADHGDEFRTVLDELRPLASLSNHPLMPAASLCRPCLTSTILRSRLAV